MPNNEEIEDIEDIEENEESTSDSTGEEESTDFSEEESTSDSDSESASVDDDEESDSDSELGNRAQKRIKKLIAGKKDAEARVKALEKQLEDARKLSGDDGKAILKAAEASGILPGLMSKAEAKAFADMDDYRKVIANYENWLDEHEPDDELELSDGKTMSYGKVERRVRKLKDELSELKDEFGDRRKELKQKVRKIFELGLEAFRKGGKTPPPSNTKKTEKRKKLHERPFTQKPKGGGSKKLNYGDISSTDDLIRMEMSRKEN